MPIPTRADLAPLDEIQVLNQQTGAVGPRKRKRWNKSTGVEAGSDRTELHSEQLEEPDMKEIHCGL